MKDDIERVGLCKILHDIENVGSCKNLRNYN